MALRRSNRLADKLYERYFLEYHEIKLKLKNLSSTCVLAHVTSEYKIESIIKLANLMRQNFAFCVTYEYTFTQNRHVEHFCDMLYKKLFEWIKETISKTDLDPIYLVNLRKAAKKYHKIYEKIRYSKWLFLKSKFELDDSIMFRINSYMHYFVSRS